MIPVYDASENYNLIKLRNIRPGLTLKFILEEVPSLLFFLVSPNHYFSVACESSSQLSVKGRPNTTTQSILNRKLRFGSTAPRVGALGMA